MQGLGKLDFLHGSTMSRQDRKRLLIVAALCALLLSAWVLFSPFGGAMRYQRLHGELADLRAQNRELLQKNEQLRREIDLIANDPVYLENLARQEYDLLRENEIIYRFDRKGR